MPAAHRETRRLPPPSPFVWGLIGRLSAVLAVIVLLWLSVAWALDWIG